MSQREEVWDTECFLWLGFNHTEFSTIEAARLEAKRFGGRPFAFLHVFRNKGQIVGIDLLAAEASTERRELVAEIDRLKAKLESIAIRCKE